MADDSIRKAMAERAGRLLRTNPEFREQLEFADEAGCRPILIALMTDTVGEVFGRLEREYPAGANVLVGDDQRAIVVTVVKRRRSATEAVVDDLAVHVESPMAMFVAYLALHAGERVRVSVVGRYASSMLSEPVGV